MFFIPFIIEKKKIEKLFTFILVYTGEEKFLINKLKIMRYNY